MVVFGESAFGFGDATGEKTVKTGAGLKVGFAEDATLLCERFLAEEEQLRRGGDEAGVGFLLIPRNDKATFVLGDDFRQVVALIVENPSALVFEPVGPP